MAVDPVPSSGELPPREVISVKQFLSETVIFGMVDVFDRAIGFILLFITTRLMTTEQYGVLGLFSTFSEILGYFVALGTLNGFFRFYTEVTDPDSKRRIMNASFWIVTVMALFVGLISLPIGLQWGARIFDADTPFYALMTLPTCYFMILIALGDSRLQADGRAWDFLKINMIQTITMRGLALILLIFGWQAAGWIIGQFCGQVITMVIFVFMAFGGIRWRFEREWIQKMVPFGAMLLPVAMSHWAMQGASKLLMRNYLEDPLSQIGLYSAGERISQIMYMLNLAFALGWRRFAFNNIHHADGPRLLGKGGTVFLIISGFGALGLIALGDDLTRWMIPETFWAGIDVIPYLVIAALCWGAGEVFNAPLYKAGKASILSTIYICAALLCVGLGVVLIPRWGIVGAAVSFMIAEIFKLSLCIWRSRREYPLEIQYGRVIAAMVVFVFLAYLCSYFKQTTVATTAAQMAVVASAPLLLFAVGAIRKSELEMIARLISRARQGEK